MYMNVRSLMFDENISDEKLNEAIWLSSFLIMF